MAATQPLPQSPHSTPLSRSSPCKAPLLLLSFPPARVLLAVCSKPAASCRRLGWGGPETAGVWRGGATPGIAAPQFLQTPPLLPLQTINAAFSCLILHPRVPPSSSQFGFLGWLSPSFHHPTPSPPTLAGHFPKSAFWGCSPCRPSPILSSSPLTTKPPLLPHTPPHICFSSEPSRRLFETKKKKNPLLPASRTWHRNHARSLIRYHPHPFPQEAQKRGARPSPSPWDHLQSYRVESLLLESPPYEDPHQLRRPLRRLDANRWMAMAELGGPLPGCQMCPRGTGYQMCPAHTHIHSPSQTRTRRDIPLPCRGCVHAQPLLRFFWAGPVQPKNLLLLLRGAGRGALGCAPGGRSHVSARALAPRSELSRVPRLGCLPLDRTGLQPGPRPGPGTVIWAPAPRRRRTVRPGAPRLVEPLFPVWKEKRE